VFRRRRFFDGRPVRRRGADALPDIAWFTPDGKEMTEEDWGSPFGRAIAVYLNGQGIPDRDARGARLVDDSFLLCFSAHYEPIDFHVPSADYGAAWHVIVDTGRPDLDDGKVIDAGDVVPVGPRALVVLQRAD
jgi:isoamylase